MLLQFIWNKSAVYGELNAERCGKVDYSWRRYGYGVYGDGDVTP